MSIRTITLVVTLLLGFAAAEAAPVSVRLPKGRAGFSCSDPRMGR